MRVRGWILILAVTLFAGARGVLAGAGPVSGASSCVAGKFVKLAGSCANTTDQPKYKDWGSNVVPYGDYFSAGKVAGDVQVQVLSAPDEVTHLVHVKLPEGRATWVNVESLQCGGGLPNVSGYVYPKNLSTDGLDPVCPPGQNGAASADNAETAATATNKNLTARFFDKAREYIESVKSSVKSDNDTLMKRFEEQSPTEKAAVLSHARTRLERTYLRLAADFGPGCSCDPVDWKKDVDPVFKPGNSAHLNRVMQACKNPGKEDLDRDRLERACRTARDGYYLAARVTEGGDASSPALFKAAYDASLTSSAVNNDQLSARMAIYYGMDYDLGKNSPPKLRYADELWDHGAKIMELHNGYLLGGKAQGGVGSPLDCGAFAMNYLFGMWRTAENQKTHKEQHEVPSVPDFETLFDRIHAIERKKPWTPPSTMSEYTNCFRTVDPRQDEILMPGDLVSSHGHITMVESYDPDKREISTFEAKSGGFGTVGIGRKPLTEPDCQGPEPAKSRNWRNRPFRSDLRVLRFDPRPGCHLKPRTE